MITCPIPRIKKLVRMEKVVASFEYDNFRK